MEMKPGYKQTEVGVIPEDWEVVTLNEVTSEIGDGIHATPQYSANGNYFFINGNNIQNGHIVITKETKSADASEFKKFRKDLTDKTLLLSINGTIGNVALYSGELIFLGKSAAYLNIHEKISRMFVFYLLQTAIVKAFFNEGLTGTTIKNLGLATIRNTPIPLPPTFAEQEAIAEALSDADAFIESLEQLIAKKRRIKQGAMQELLTGKRRLLGFAKKTGYRQTEVGEIAEDWIVESIGEISVVGRGRVISHNEISKSLNPLYPVYSSQTSNDGIMGYIDTFDFEGEYITWTTDGANAGTVFYRNGKFNCTNVCGTLKLKRYDHYFIARVLSRFAYKHVSRHLGNPKIMNDVMKKVKIPIPPIVEEQTAIAAILSDMDAEIAALEAKLAKARQLKQGMMQELLTGRIRLI